MRFLNILILLSLLLSSYIASFPITFLKPGSASSCFDPVSCFLQSIEFTLPDISVEVEGSVLTLTDTFCNGIDLKSIPSSYDHATSLNVGMGGLAGHCKGNYQYGKLMRGTMSIDMDHTNATMKVYTKKQGEFPTHMSLSSCSIDPINLDITFSSPGLDSLAPVIAGVIKNLMEKTLCKGVNNILETNVSSLIVNTIDPKLQEMISHEADPFPIYNKRYLNWNDSIISEIHNLILKTTGLTNLPDFLKCMQNDLKTFSSNGANEDSPSYVKYFRKLFERQTIDVSQWEKNILFSSETVSIQLQEVTFSGLETVNNLEILEPLPESKVTLRSAIGFDSLQLDLALLVTIPYGEGEIYTENTTVSFTVEKADFLFDLVIAVDEHLLDSFHLDQLSSLGCWLGSVTEISIPNLSLNVASANLVVKEVSGDAKLLESDLVSFTDNIFLLLLSNTGFGSLAIDTIQGVFQGPIREALNTQIQTRLVEAKQTHPCLSHYPYDDVKEYIQWPESKVVSGLNKVINDVFGYQGINQLFSCATDGTGAFAVYTTHLTITLSGMNSFYGLSLFTPNHLQPYHLATSLAAGFCPDKDSANNCNPLKIGISAVSQDYIASMFGTDSGVTTAVTAVMNDASLYFTFQNFQISVETFVQLNLNMLKQLQRSQLGTTGCSASSLDTLQFQFLDMNVSNSYVIYHDDITLRETTYGMNLILSFLGGNRTITNKNNQIAMELNNAPAVCAAGGVQPEDADTDSSTNSSKEEKDYTLEIIIFVGSLVTALLVLYYSYQWSQSPKIIDDRCLWDRWDFDNALMFREDIPLWVRIALPLGIATSFVFFVVSDAGSAVEVIFKIHIGEKTIDLGTVFEFGLSGTLTDVRRSFFLLLSLFCFNNCTSSFY
jgi:hypothetical protein